MSDQVAIYLELGFDHILDIEGYDHMLFLLALCAGYTLNDYKKLLWLVTAFTVGHSITLVLAVLDIITVPTAIIEWLIPVTIAATALYDLILEKATSHKGKYLLTVVFGLVHGMGFSNFLRSMFRSPDDLVLPLVGFNIGLELGQLLFVGLLVITSTTLIKAGLQQGWWSKILSMIALSISIWMVIERWPW